MSPLKSLSKADDDTIIIYWKMVAQQSYSVNSSENEVCVCVKCVCVSCDVTMTSGSKMSAIFDPPSWISCFFQNLSKLPTLTKK